MKKEKRFFSYMIKGRGFYMTAAICLCLIVAAVSAIYKSAGDLMKNYLVSEITSTTEAATQQAEANKDDEPDTRQTTTEITAVTEKETTAEKTTQVKESQKQETSFGNTSYIYPVSSDILKDYYDTPVYDETMEDWRVHKGIDFLCEKGTSVCAVGAGRVINVSADASYGYCVEIDHGDFVAKYCGLEQGTTVKIDDEVKQNDVVGLTGEIYCEAAQQAHFHFETTKDGVKTDPLDMLKK